jgi:hypothetical protein
MSIKASVGSLVVFAGMLGCAGTSDYVYRPETTNATAAGLPADHRPIPQEQPQGSIQVVSYGVTELRRDGHHIPALHVRATITNDGDDTPWTFDTTKQMLSIPGEGQSRAMYVNADVGTLPNVTIARRERRVVDFYFPLPETTDRESELSRFELLWQVNTPARTVSSRTAFSRVDQSPKVEYVAVAPAWPLWAGHGPHWWYDPFYPRTVFIHARPWRFHGPGRVVVGRFDGRFRATQPREVHGRR